MDYLPISLDVRGKRVAVVGGGTVAARKAARALGAGADVAVFAQALGEAFEPLRRHARLTHRTADPTVEDFAACALVFCATSSAAFNTRMASLAREARVPVNVADSPALCDFLMPALVDRTPLLIAVSTSGAAPVFARLVRAQIERTLPANLGRAISFLGGYRQRVSQVLPDGDSRRRFWEQIADSVVLERALRGDETGAAHELERLLAAARDAAASRTGGEVWLVGAGPGDPELLTLRAFRLMQCADVVVHDRLVDARIIELVRSDAERICVGKRAGQPGISQEKIRALLVRLARAGRRVLRLKGGDPFVFGRGGEELEQLIREQIPVVVVPGVTAATGCAAYAGIPLTHRDHAQACLFVTAHSGRPELGLDWTALLRPRQTVAVYMGLTRLPALMEEFAAHGADRDTPAALIDNGTRPAQRVLIGTLGTLAALASEANLQGPAIVIVGNVVRCAREQPLAERARAGLIST